MASVFMLEHSARNVAANWSCDDCYLHVFLCIVSFRFGWYSQT